MTAMPPAAEAIELPDGYGVRSGRTLSWTDVSDRLAVAPRYWLASVRPDGRPHVVPADGLWVDDSLWFGGAGETVHLRNLVRNPPAVAHLEDGKRAVMVEGRATLTVPSPCRPRASRRCQSPSTGLRPRSRRTASACGG